MAVTAKITGMEDISGMLEKLEEKANFVASQALYKGAGEMAKAINNAAKSIRTEPFKYAKPDAYRMPSPEEKQILLENGALGIAKFDQNGSEVNTSVGYNKAGYADVSWNHMSSSARTNYKAQEFKGLENMTTSTLKAAGVYQRNVQNRKPIGVIANSINSGTSFMKKQPFVRQGVSAGTKAAEQAIRNTAERLFNEIIKKNETGGKSA